MNQNPIRIAFFISPHGFGHAARAVAVMLALHANNPLIAFDIYTIVPEWFFKESHCSNYIYHSCLTDVGLVQKTSMDEDLEKTITKLSELYPPRAEMIDNLAKILSQENSLVICDISPIGLAAAHAAHLPSILIENFTWDWIYSGYSQSEPRFIPYMDVLAALNQLASYHIQTTPVCLPCANDLCSNPVSRPVQSPRLHIRQQLGIAEDEICVLVTMGGIEAAYSSLERFYHLSDIVLILPGSSQHIHRQENLVLLPHHSGIYHPDLLNASDAVVGKLGYSTLSEAYSSGIPYGFIPRKYFIESPPLVDFVLTHMSGLEISAADFESDRWLEHLPALVAQPHGHPDPVNGADQIVAFLSSKFDI